MAEKSLIHIERQIAMIKRELLDIDEMRPGSITRQYKNPKKREGGFYQLSYTHRNKSKTEYVRARDVEELKQQVHSYKRFKELIQRWIDLAIEYSKLKLERDNLGKLK
ncbi:MAG: DUF6788 family protein [Acidobacteriota bacterium]